MHIERAGIYLKYSKTEEGIAVNRTMAFVIWVFILLLCAAVDNDEKTAPRQAAAPTLVSSLQ